MYTIFLTIASSYQFSTKSTPYFIIDQSNPLIELKWIKDLQQNLFLLYSV